MSDRPVETAQGSSLCPEGRSGPSLDEKGRSTLKGGTDKRPTSSDISALPDDLLTEVFTFALACSKSMWGMEEPLQYVLSLVCSRWRELLLHSPLLWADIFISTFPLFDPFIFFERSHPALIDVTYSSASDMTWEYMNRVSTAIVKHISRLRSLTINVCGPEEIHSLFLPWRDIDASNLKTLDISSIENPVTFLTSHEPENEIPSWLSADALRSIRLDGLETRNLPRLPNLATLELDKTRLCSPQLRSILNNCPMLENLIIHRFGSHYGVLDESGDVQVEAPSLRSLAINMENDHGENCACALPFLSMRNLQYLEVSYLWPNFTQHHASILSRWKDLPELTTLRIHSTSFWGNDISFLSGLPNDTVLEIVGFPKSENTALLQILGLSNLRSISIDLSSPRFPMNSIDLDEFRKDVLQETPTLRCPVVLHCANTDQGMKLQGDLGRFFTVQSSPARKGILDDYLANNVFDDDTLLNRLLGLDDSSDDEEFEDGGDYEFDYESWEEQEFENEYDFEDEDFFYDI